MSFTSGTPTTASCVTGFIPKTLIRMNFPVATTRDVYVFGGRSG